MHSREHAGGTLGEVLAARRAGRFVGRHTEVRTFLAALTSPDTAVPVLHVHGPGGIGKTALLDHFARLANERGLPVARVDGRDVEPSPAALRAALSAALGAAGERSVVLLDSYERLTPLDDWVGGVLLPGLPATTLTVLAGRTPPSEAWRADPAWRDLSKTVALRNLSAEESRDYLRLSGVADELHDRLLAASYGHPLGLSLLADLACRGEEVSVDPLAPDLVGVLLRRFVDALPDDRQRRALGVSALARATTEELLRHALDLDDAHAEFDWLRQLSFVETGPDGIFPHDLARDTLDADLRWRDREQYGIVFRRVRAHAHRQLRHTSGREQQRAIFDQKYLFRNLPSILSPIDWGSWGQRYPEVARPDEHAEIVALIAGAEGEDAAAIAQRWLSAQPEGFFVLRDGDGVQGVVAHLDLSAASPADRRVDPGVAAAWDFARRHGTPRPGEVVLQQRFLVDAAVYQDPSATMNATPVVTIQRYLRTPGLVRDFLTLAEPEVWDPYFAVADFQRAHGADFTVGGRRFGLYSHDFRRVPLGPWLELVTDRALSQDLTLPSPAADTLVLSADDFAHAVRCALRDLHRPEGLRRNPLTRTRLVVEHGAEGEDPGGVLSRLLTAAVAGLDAHPRDHRKARAVDRTYVRPAANQEAAAEALALPFSTYRRHLSQGVARIVERLWEAELNGIVSGAN